MDQHFERHELDLLDVIEEVEIETVRSDTHSPHRSIIWIVVVASDAYVRSVNGHEAHWYQQLVADAGGTLHADGHMLPIRAVPVPDALIRTQVSEAYQHKYGHYPQDVAWLIGPDVQATTLRLVPKRPSGAS